jgi:hypothetical protein
MNAVGGVALITLGINAFNSKVFKISNQRTVLTYGAIQVGCALAFDYLLKPLTEKLAAQTQNILEKEVVDYTDWQDLAINAAFCGSVALTAGIVSIILGKKLTNHLHHDLKWREVIKIEGIKIAECTALVLGLIGLGAYMQAQQEPQLVEQKLEELRKAAKDWREAEDSLSRTQDDFIKFLEEEGKPKLNAINEKITNLKEVVEKINKIEKQRIDTTVEEHGVRLDEGIIKADD